jgi:predicted dehydrogenase
MEADVPLKTMTWLRRLFPSSPNPRDDRFGYAVVGLGHGAEKMCEALRDSPHARVTAAVSSSLDRAERFARRYRIPHVATYDSFASLADNPDVDAAYLALPVAPHRRFTELAAQAGKHVLCEKPMAARIADAEAMITTCQRADRLLMLAYRLDYDPVHHELARLLASGTLGRVEHVTSGFGFVAKPGWRFNPALAGGGSLFDVGVYPIHALHALFGKPTLDSAEILEDRSTRMELEATWRGALGGGATFECSSSYVRRIPDHLHVRCERGNVALTHAYAYERTQLRADFADSHGQPQTVRFSDGRGNPSLFRLEAEHLAHAARTHTPLTTPGESGLRDLQTVADIEAIARRRVC